MTYKSGSRLLQLVFMLIYVLEETLEATKTCEKMMNKH